MDTTHFALKGALEYTVVGARGARLYRFKKGEPLEVAIPEDVRKFRGQPDLYFECDGAGNALDPAAVAGQAPPAPRSFKSFRSEPEPAPARPGAEPPAPPPVRPSPPVADPALSEEAEPPAGDAGAETEGETPEPEAASEPDKPARGRTTRRPRGGP